MIKIEVTGSSIAEVSDKLLAIGASLQRTVSLDTPTVEVAEAAPVHPTPAPKSAPAAEVSESQPTTEEPSTTPAPSVEPLEKEAAVSNELNFDTDVAPVVLKVVKDKGKPVVQAILLEEFGVERASLLDPALWPELVAKLKDAG